MRRTVAMTIVLHLAFFAIAMALPNAGSCCCSMSGASCPMRIHCASSCSIGGKTFAVAPLRAVMRTATMAMPLVAQRELVAPTTRIFTTDTRTPEPPPPRRA